MELPPQPETTTEQFERALAESGPVAYCLVLYVAGTAPRSLRAIRQVRRLCDEYLTGCCELQIVDIYQQPALAEAAGILAVPALIKHEPPPELRFVGDMSDLARLASGLGLVAVSPGGHAG